MYDHFWPLRSLLMKIWYMKILQDIYYFPGKLYFSTNFLFLLLESSVQGKWIESGRDLGELKPLLDDHLFHPKRFIHFVNDLFYSLIYGETIILSPPLSATVIIVITSIITQGGLCSTSGTTKHSYGDYCYYCWNVIHKQWAIVLLLKLTGHFVIPRNLWYCFFLWLSSTLKAYSQFSNSTWISS